MAIFKVSEIGITIIFKSPTHKNFSFLKTAHYTQVFKINQVKA